MQDDIADLRYSRQGIKKGYLSFYFVINQITFSLVLCYNAVFVLEGELEFIHIH